MSTQSAGFSMPHHAALERDCIQIMSTQSAELSIVLQYLSRRVYRDSLDPAQETEVIQTNACVERINEDVRLLFHQHNAQNQRNYRHNQGINELDANYKQYLLQFDNPDKITL